ncbi:MAG TPA: glycerol-3-phosphate 1-O-acyltransferase PlsY [Rheinheimera sp.]|jgi:glycerol-3-phosphate acyltransferase PlsY|uniref:Glycerol-3-phosphate acyltransferase n=1 Tax=Rheinheimera aquimaris TaxID=412437 RepID=A0ABP3P924_9GAMM|nr:MULTISPECIES: glycerol-3-phosphate 1-O-acyltransferase PlsY [Rheinheimera]MBJ91371.1 glycerol-3-phosphate acyltransferase [Alteromonadaceae bacterium]MCB5214971.1 glycerol-3-phosphate 1-O-acyltransferase PlsY [Rheinheimera aquimaris]MCD1600273.1 glycerol-3-phosphate 1-O-acyltransferase PlsY [Rheinheimera aquimaris]HBN89692.1 glycerol-3-phosphate acyltransferase [Rheinheimera sp.]|tara:strand:- start:434 stop:1039 length:606 start_codon:yes stop_codon:yes gene_type:complete
MTPLIGIMMLAAYLCGSISSAVLVSKLFRLPDPRLHGSGNPGATNVLRLGGKVPAVLVLVFDILKGTIPVWGSYFLKIEPLYLGLIAICACVGHIFPLFFGFKGGKAVATAFGAMMPIGLDLAGLLIGSWLVIVALSGYSSLAAILTVSLAPVFTWFIKPLYTIPVSMLSVLIILRHRENIVRLWQGKESKVWDKTKRIRE